MDLYAYTQIEKLHPIAERNNIQCPRLRGYRLMMEELTYSEEEIQELVEQFGEEAREQYKMFNKYAGKQDVLYIHARIGGGNWNSYKDEVEGKDWFIEKVDDCYDNTYCDIYARIK